MQSKVTTPEEYISELSDDRKQVIIQLRDAILNNLPEGFEEVMSYGMISYVVPHSLYPTGYHCEPKKPLPFLSIASQKNYVAVYHIALYSDQQVLNWFKEEYGKKQKGKLDMGKSCIRFKKLEQIPYSLLGELAAKITPQEWIATYEKQIKR
ncbi:DUF1801 domain-containing protein [Pontibacter russatus]|uniref:DUF1801 domain-containing protein n=1 Tax=Pontibacter russatus TaxID=2694929 RepID=UPI00137B8C0D|nr:DUF1801 domain-containing protein [Pontibacter russatus]